MATGYANLIAEQPEPDDDYEMNRRLGLSPGNDARTARGRSIGGSRGGGDCGHSGSACRSAVIATMLVAAMASAGLSVWSGYRFFSDKQLACKYVTFALDTVSMPQCGWPTHHHEPPCMMNSTAYVASRMYNSALGPWKIVESAKSWNSDEKCEMQLSRQDTHLIIAKTGLYQLSAQVTFAKQDIGSSAELVWQVNHAEWIAQDKSRGAAGGPTQTYLSAVRRLQAGQKVSLHLRQAPRAIATDPARTHVALSLL